MTPEIISFYTKNTPYEKEVEGLRSSCEQFNLKHDIVGIDTLGDWEVNCCYKSKFILDQLEKKKKPLLWIDANGKVNQELKLFDTISTDLAIWINPTATIHHRSKVISSTVYINYTEKVLELVRLWKKLCEETLTDPDRTVEIWDQTCLRDAIFHEENKADALPLPDTYCARFDDPIEGDPVITQYQASRLYKSCINGEVVSFWESLSLKSSRDLRNSSM